MPPLHPGARGAVKFPLHRSIEFRFLPMKYHEPLISGGSADIGIGRYWQLLERGVLGPVLSETARRSTLSL